jgi:aryl-alcohol dehydrogenase-like predicted oxidoreductase
MRQHTVRRLLESSTLDVEARIAASTLLWLGGGPAASAECEPRVLEHLRLLDDALAGRAPRAPRRRRVLTGGPSPHLRELGRTGILVHPFGLSGAHGLCFDDFALAHDRGANLFFWEPSHRELARFLRSRGRSGTLVVAGTYNADATSIEADVGRSLRLLRREAIDVFLAFWTRSPARIDEVADVLCRLKRRGLVRATGASTHDRGLACAAADRGLDVVMVRHSAAHRGAESMVFPHCAARGTGVITFSNLCYGRMLLPTPAVLNTKVTAPDCYRYSLSQPGVRACIAAPRRHSELAENLEVVDRPGLDQARQAELRAHGDHVYARSKAWSAEVWGTDPSPGPERRAARGVDGGSGVLPGGAVIACPRSPVLLPELASRPRCTVAAERHRHSSNGRSAGRTAALLPRSSLQSK